jgi:eukaryotic-like serine/threonine-protein kinase
MLAGGLSCEAAQNSYVEEMKMGQRGQADITAGQYGAILNSGHYLGGCGVPDSMSVNICAAIQNGRAVGVTVTTNPRNGGVAGCISSAVRRINFPAHPKLDVTRTSFAAAR